MLYAQLALALIATTLVAAGCGSSKNSSATTAATATPTTASVATTPSTATTTTGAATGKALTRSQWIAKGDSICARANTRVSSITIVNAREFARQIPQVALYNRTETGELSRLVPPAPMASDWARILKEYEAYDEYTNRIAQYAQAGNYVSAGPILHIAEKLRAQIAALAKRDGFKQCSKVIS
jgi:hypothetical protein